MGEVITIGLDIAKSVFQVHGVDGAGGSDPQAGQPGENVGVFRRATASIEPMTSLVTQKLPPFYLSWASVPR